MGTTILNGKRFNILSLSDTHLGNFNTPELIDAIETAIVPIIEHGKEPLDLIVLGGDIYDRLKTLEDNESIFIQEWILRLIRLCSIHKILLRVLEGTPSHDRRQSKQFILLAEAVKELYPCDIRYITQIEIEYIDKYNVYFLYVPDEASPNTNQTLSIVKEKMSNIGINQVDYAIVHGGFDFHFPVNSKAHKHSSEHYLKIVKKYIFIGHIHQHSVNQKRLLTNGSFDRHSHGDEGKKGCWLVYNTVDGRDSDKLYFIENKKATIFKTIYLTSNDVDTVAKEIIAPIANIKHTSIRIRCELPEVMSTAKAKLPKLFPNVKWSFELVGEKEEHVPYMAPLTFTPLILNKTTLPDIILGRVGDSMDKKLLQSLLSEVL